MNEIERLKARIARLETLLAQIDHCCRMMRQLQRAMTTDDNSKLKPKGPKP